MHFETGVRIVAYCCGVSCRFVLWPPRPLWCLSFEDSNLSVSDLYFLTCKQAELLFALTCSGVFNVGDLRNSILEVNLQ